MSHAIFVAVPYSSIRAGISFLYCNMNECMGGCSVLYLGSM